MPHADTLFPFPQHIETHLVLGTDEPRWIKNITLQYYPPHHFGC